MISNPLDIGLYVGELYSKINLSSELRNLFQQNKYCRKYEFDQYSYRCVRLARPTNALSGTNVIEFVERYLIRKCHRYNI